MSGKSRNSMLWAMALVVLGVVVFFAGTGWLVVLLPAAIFVWYSARPMLGSGRN